jgi:hypothetical protein
MYLHYITIYSIYRIFSSQEPSKWWPRFRKVLVLSYGPPAIQLSESMATPRGPTEVRFNHVPGPGLGAILEGWSDELPEPSNVDNYMGLSGNRVYSQL